MPRQERVARLHGVAALACTLVSFWGTVFAGGQRQKLGETFEQAEPMRAHNHTTIRMHGDLLDVASQFHVHLGWVATGEHRIQAEESFDCRVDVEHLVRASGLVVQAGQLRLDLLLAHDCLVEFRLDALANSGRQDRVCQGLRPAGSFGLNLCQRALQLGSAILVPRSQAQQLGPYLADQLLEPHRSSASTILRKPKQSLAQPRHKYAPKPIAAHLAPVGATRVQRGRARVIVVIQTPSLGWTHRAAALGAAHQTTQRVLQRDARGKRLDLSAARLPFPRTSRSNALAPLTPLLLDGIPHFAPDDWLAELFNVDDFVLVVAGRHAAIVDNIGSESVEPQSADVDRITQDVVDLRRAHLAVSDNELHILIEVFGDASAAPAIFAGEREHPQRHRARLGIGNQRAVVDFGRLGIRLHYASELVAHRRWPTGPVSQPGRVYLAS